MHPPHLRNSPRSTGFLLANRSKMPGNLLTHILIGLLANSTKKVLKIPMAKFTCVSVDRSAVATAAANGSFCSPLVTAQRLQRVKSWPKPRTIRSEFWGKNNNPPISMYSDASNPNEFPVPTREISTSGTPWSSSEAAVAKRLKFQVEWDI